MALITCPDCGTQASDQAFSCPRCARPLRATATKKQGLSVVLIVVIVAAVLVVPVVGILATLSIYGTRKYIANAKTAEAKNTLGQLAKDAVTAYEGERLAVEGKAHVRKLCASASAAVPSDPLAVRGRKYRSTAADWQRDAANDAGFACLRFEMTSPQYFQYEYESTRTSFVARAHGDLNGDGKRSTFEITGQVVDGQVVIAPTIIETDPEE